MQAKNRKLTLVSADELEMRGSRQSDWAMWRLDCRRAVLYTDPKSVVGYRYEIDLETCTTSAEVLDWIMHINGKNWGPNVTTGLVNAFADILLPMHTLCSWGQSKTLTSAGIRHLVARAGAA